MKNREEIERLQRTGNIPKETLDYLADKKKPVNALATLIVLGLFVGMIGLAFFVVRAFTSHVTTAENRPRPQSADASVAAAKPSPTCDLKTAISILATLQNENLAQVVTTSDVSTWTFDRSTWSVTKPKIHQLMHTIADSDACTFGRPRAINFRSPDGALLGYVSPSGMHID